MRQRNFLLRAELRNAPSQAGSHDATFSLQKQKHLDQLLAVSQPSHGSVATAPSLTGEDNQRQFRTLSDSGGHQSFWLIKACIYPSTSLGEECYPILFAD